MKAFHLAAVAALAAGLATGLAAGLAACGTQAAGPPAEPPVAVAAATPATAAAAVPARTAAASAGIARTAAARPPGPALIVTGPATLTVADNGAVVRLRTGQQVAVTLTPGVLFSWHVPAAAGAAVRRVSAGGGYPGRQPARAAFLAVQSGEATLTTIDDTACLHAQPACEPAQQEWRVTIIVTA